MGRVQGARSVGGLRDRGPGAVEGLSQSPVVVSWLIIEWGVSGEWGVGSTRPDLSRGKANYWCRV